MSDVIVQDNKKDDLISAGFKKLDDNIFHKNAPKINWGMLYYKKSDEQKISYLEKLASSMNHAAYIIQNERNELTNLCQMKEKQIENMKTSVEQNMNMLNIEITKMNQYKQDFNTHVAMLNKQIRELKDK